MSFSRPGFACLLLLLSGWSAACDPPEQAQVAETAGRPFAVHYIDESWGMKGVIYHGDDRPPRAAITAVNTGKLAWSLGLRANDSVYSINGRTFTSAADIDQAYRDLLGGEYPKAIEVQFTRSGYDLGLQTTTATRYKSTGTITLTTAGLIPDGVRIARE